MLSRDVMWSLVSVDRGKGKKSAWQAWNVCEDVTETFKKLSNCPQEVSNDDLQKLQIFVVLMYDRSSAASCVNEARLDHFARKQRTYDTIPLGIVELCAKILQIMRNDFKDYARTFCQLCAPFSVLYYT